MQPAILDTEPDQLPSYTRLGKVQPALRSRLDIQQTHSSKNKNRAVLWSSTVKVDDIEGGHCVHDAVLSSLERNAQLVHFSAPWRGMRSSAPLAEPCSTKSLQPRQKFMGLPWPVWVTNSNPTKHARLRSEPISWSP